MRTVWPDDELIGTSTGEPAGDLREWVTEVAIWLDEAIATADERYVRRRRDPVAGHTIVEFAPCSTVAPVGLVTEPGRWRVYSTDQEPAGFENEWYAWGDLFGRVQRRWPAEVAAAVDRWNGDD